MTQPDDAQQSSQSDSSDGRGALHAGEAEVQLCKLAFVGLLWSVAFVVVAIPTILVMDFAEEGAVASLGQHVFQGLAWLSLAGVIGGPLLSSMAISKIRSSQGRLGGLGAALIGLWLIPIAVIDALVFALLLGLIDYVLDDSDMIYLLQLASFVLILVAGCAAMVWIVRRSGRITASS